MNTIPVLNSKREVIGYLKYENDHDMWAYRLAANDNGESGYLSRSLALQACKRAHRDYIDGDVNPFYGMAIEQWNPDLDPRDSDTTESMDFESPLELLVVTPWTHQSCPHAHTVFADSTAELAKLLYEHGLTVVNPATKTYWDQQHDCRMPLTTVESSELVEEDDDEESDYFDEEPEDESEEDDDA